MDGFDRFCIALFMIGAIICIGAIITIPIDNSNRIEKLEAACYDKNTNTN